MSNARGNYLADLKDEEKKLMQIIKDLDLTL